MKLNLTISFNPRKTSIIALLALSIVLIMVNIFWNPPYSKYLTNLIIVPDSISMEQTQKLIDGLNRYREAINLQDISEPESVKLTKLINDGYLNASDVESLLTQETTFYFYPKHNTDIVNPVIIKTELKDNAVLAFADGSVITFSQERLQEHILNSPAEYLR